MKKILLIIAVFFLVPMNVFAKTYEVENSGFKITFDEQIWDVFASGEQFDEELLKKYDWDNETMQNYLNDNNMYIYAVYNGEELFEFAVRYGHENANQEIKDYDKFGASLAQKRGADNYQIYENKYKYVKLEYYESVNKLYIIDYYIIVNSQYYVLTAQKSTQFLDDEKLEIKKVVDNIIFDTNSIKSFQIDWMSAINSGIASMIGAIIMYLVLRKKIKK